MLVQKDDVAYIAQLSRLKFTDAKQEAFLPEFNQILEHVSRLSSIDTEGVEPCSNVFELKNVMRDDVFSPSMDRDLLMRTAPDQDNGAYAVPKVVE